MKQGPPKVTQQMTAKCPLWKPCNLLPNHEKEIELIQGLKVVLY
jgi:hypothetical protein